jgi:hypothetical protein
MRALKCRTLVVAVVIFVLGATEGILGIPRFMHAIPAGTSGETRGI